MTLIGTCQATNKTESQRCRMLIFYFSYHYAYYDNYHFRIHMMLFYQKFDFGLDPLFRSSKHSSLSTSSVLGELILFVENLIETRRTKFHEVIMSFELQRYEAAKSALAQAEAFFHSAKAEMVNSVELPQPMEVPTYFGDVGNSRPQLDQGTVEGMVCSVRDEVESLRKDLEKVHVRLKDCEKALHIKQGNDVTDLRDKLFSENPSMRSSSSTYSNDTFGKSSIYSNSYRKDRRAPLVTNGANRDPFHRKSYGDDRGSKYYEKKRYLPGAKYHKKYD